MIQLLPMRCLVMQKHMLYKYSKNTITIMFITNIQCTKYIAIHAYLPLGQSRLMPSRTRNCPSHRTPQRRSAGPQLICTTSPGVETSSHTEPSGLKWLMPSRNHTYTNTQQVHIIQLVIFCVTSNYF